ncbi:unnamed protein product [Ranitomeya imitator]|uniref:Rhodopsin n=1 Tax=Ranitomeya imitator TaxID=111125 RepID=A0ABN9MP94_9NEOB|nr:unnamed protein product [Ranitomeya imitator]
MERSPGRREERERPVLDPRGRRTKESSARKTMWNPNAPGQPAYPPNPAYPPSTNPAHPPVPPLQPGYPAGQPVYPPGQPAYPPGGPGYPAGHPSYPGQPGYPPPHSGPYPPGVPGYPVNPMMPGYPMDKKMRKKMKKAHKANKHGHGYGKPDYPSGQPVYPSGQPAYPPGQPGYPIGHPCYPVQPGYPPPHSGPFLPGMAGYLMDKKMRKKMKKAHKHARGEKKQENHRSITAVGLQRSSLGRTGSSDQRYHSRIQIAAACQTQRDRYPGCCNVTDRCCSRCKVAECEDHTSGTDRSSYFVLSHSVTIFFLLKRSKHT